jgi:hypothetical protein
MAALHGGSALSSLIHSRLRVPVIRVAALVGLGLFAAPAVASASCPTQPVSTPFSEWGDTDSYFPLPGGSFEGAADELGWTLSEASLSSGNEPFLVNSSGDGQSLSITGGGRATSPFFCVDKTMSSLRFFADQAAAGGDLQVQALVQTPTGIHTVSVADLADGSMPSWAPSQPITGVSGTLSDGASLMVALQFSVPASAASWQIDDVYVDPYRSG